MKKVIIFAISFIFIGNLVIYGQQSLETVQQTHLVQIAPNSYNMGCEITESCFLPSEIYIKQGDTIKWINHDDALHTITSGIPTRADNIFDSGLLKSNENFSYTFTENNKSYSYYCTLHPWMIGHVVVGKAELIKIQPEIPEKIPTIFDNDFKIEQLVSGLTVPTTMTFIDNDILVLQKNDGKVHLIRDGVLEDKPVLDVEVSNYGEQGLLGITNVNSTVYLFFTEAFHDGGLSLGNRIYKYEWDGQKLSNPQLMRTLPGWTVAYNGGVMTSDSKGNVYAVSGSHYKFGELQNFPKSESFRCYTNKSICDNSDKITIWNSLRKSLSCIKVSFHYYTTNPYGHQSEQPDMSNNPLENNPTYVLGNIQSCINEFFFDNFSDGNWHDTSVVLKVDSDEYRAIGIRNSFGITIDPLTGNLWMTENGPERFDEINLVSEKFNSGWAKVIGIVDEKKYPIVEGYEEYLYSQPEFNWELPIGITALSFANSEQYAKYKGWLFVGDSNNGNIYKFKLNTQRTGFELQTPHLKDLIVNIDPESNDYHESMDEILFGINFGIISDLKFGPDGSMYVVSLTSGTIYKIIPK